MLGRFGQELPDCVAGFKLKLSTDAEKEKPNLDYRYSSSLFKFQILD